MNQKTIIAVWNSANKGKTSTLRYLAHLIRVKYKENIEVIDECEINNNNNDFIFNFSLNGMVFSIVSEGDVGSKVVKNLNLLKESNVIICCTRTKGKTVNAVEYFCKENNAKLIWSKTYEIDKELKNDKEYIAEANSLKAKHLLRLMQKIKLL